MAKYDIMIARSPYGNKEVPDIGDWLVKTELYLRSRPDVGSILHHRIDDTPADMVRNRMVEDAKEAKVDYLLMVDADMRPDFPKPGARPFVASSLDFALSHHGPCVIAAPYSGPSPHQNMYVFTWRNLKSNNPNPDLQMRQFEREEAAARSGMEEVAALPTGLILIDMRVFDVLAYEDEKGGVQPAAPYFYYEYKDKFNAHKSSTEDVTFTRDCSLAGVPVYCNWDAWCGHWKNELVPPPVVLTVDDVRETYRQVILRNRRQGAALMQAGVRCQPKRSKADGAGVKKEQLQGIGDDNSGPSATFMVPFST